MTESFGICHCNNVDFGTYENQVVMRHPSGKLVGIDTCIATEIGWLWHKGVNTLNSCCGHKKLPATVIVHPDDYDKMDELGYKFDITPSGRREYFLKTKGGWVSSKYDDTVKAP